MRSRAHHLSHIYDSIILYFALYVAGELLLIIICEFFSFSVCNTLRNL